jgi:hypothetical protein
MFTSPTLSDLVYVSPREEAHAAYADVAPQRYVVRGVVGRRRGEPARVEDSLDLAPGPTGRSLRSYLEEVLTARVVGQTSWDRLRRVVPILHLGCGRGGEQVPDLHPHGAVIEGEGLASRSASTPSSVGQATRRDYFLTEANG